MKQARNPESVHPPIGRYVHQIEVSGENRFLFISEAAGFEATDVVKIVTYVVGDIDPVRRRAALDAAFGSHVTTSTLLYVPRLASPTYLVEVDAWAVRAGES